MFSWCISKFGGADQLTLTQQDGYRPLPGPQEVLVKTSAHSINPIDVHVLGGYGARFLGLFRDFPLTLGRDFVGEVVTCGPKVTNFQPGDRVMGMLPLLKQGTHSTFLVVSQENVVKKPANLEDIEAACLPLAGMTAWCVLKTSGLKNARVLVLGGSGGVGSIAVQMLKAWGCQVVTTCSKDAVPQLEAYKLLKVIDYRSADYNKQIEFNGPYNLIFNAAGMLGTPHLENLKKWQLSKYVTITHSFMTNTDVYGLIFGILKSLIEIIALNIFSLATQGAVVKWGAVTPSSKGLEELAHLASEGKIQPLIYKTFKFSEMPLAFKCQQEGHTRGKIVVAMDM
ncbi:reticulon-4-interacting protein 1, mitochondrial-like [Neocloeon triangulifer]|uniref:reticulon-4-interacting protein 1, mitochondrial-like n=1 Tax=Neocloeon triangulifer TaxID=2078957 RepID=UPI00286F9ADF|nr:reticulon-4-interacting protein 1, mitochondrial-like [Neocloeon triangulifer]